jgi:hypothetical protein
MRKTLLLVTISALTFSTTRAQNVLELYSRAELAASQRVYSPNAHDVWQNDFLPVLTASERARAGAVSLSLPLVGLRQHPLEFYASAVRHEVVLPISSIRFIDDLAIAFSYYEEHGCGSGPISDYVAALRFHSAGDGMDPLEALGVPPISTLKGTRIDDIAQKILKSTMYFIGAHEYAHVMYRHRDYGVLTASEAQAQETASDAFAIDVMRRIGVPPIGLTYFFLVASRLERSPGEFFTTDAYETYLRGEVTHPVSAIRILQIANSLETNIGAFSRLQDNPVLWQVQLRNMASMLREISSTLDDRGMRRYLAERARSADMGAFRRACRPLCVPLSR